MPFSLALLPALAGLALILVRLESRTALAWSAGAALGATLALAIAAAAAGWSGRLAWSDALVLEAALTPGSALVAILVPAIALPVVVYAAFHEARAGLARLVGLLLVFVGGMELLVVAADFLTLLIGWEIVGALSWALIGHDWREAENPASGLYAFVATRLGDLGLILAAIALFAGTGSFAYADLAALDEATLTLIAFGILLSAAAKAGQVPFSPWLFRAMAGPTSVSALLHAATMVAAGAYILARLQPSLAAAPGFSQATLAIGLVTAFAGGIVAVLQNHAKRLLAASTSAQFGLMLVAVGAGYPGVALLHLAAHAAFKALLFLAAGTAGERVGSFALDRMGLGRALPGVAVAAAIGAAALAAIPPLGAAWTKEEIVAAAGHADPLLAGAVMLAGALSAAYGARFLLLAYGPAENPPGGPAPSRTEVAAAWALALASVALGVLWLPGAHEPLATALGADLPRGAAWEAALSLVLVAAGLLAGRALARTTPALGTRGAPAAAAAWLGLPALIDAALVRPFLALADAADRVDRAVLDAIPGGAARTGRRLRDGLAALDRRRVDAAPRGIAGLGRAAAAALARADGRVVDAGIRATAALAQAFAGLSDRIGERLADGLPTGATRLALLGGRDARRLHTGLSHHYYALGVAGAAVLVLLLLVLA
ncbi:proton-conducting transporter membrane subunit [Salinarimonas sp.]|uniref:proton-conducting transporter transmembrane domain-containing protein n=1 Tax=Salinarimonas sp. TaxID=2766526 RepID=UPI0032D9A46A